MMLQRKCKYADLSHCFNFFNQYSVFLVTECNCTLLIVVLYCVVLYCIVLYCKLEQLGANMYVYYLEKLVLSYIRTRLTAINMNICSLGLKYTNKSIIDKDLHFDNQIETSLSASLMNRPYNPIAITPAIYSVWFCTFVGIMVNCYAKIRRANHGEITIISDDCKTF